MLLAGCASEPVTRVTAKPQSSECVVLLHGLNRSWRAMRPLAETLHDDGFTTVNVDYPSQTGTVEELAPVVIGLGVNACRGAGAATTHFVTHSMGGILLRHENERAPIEGLGRVVMLGPPNQGSEIIEKTENWPFFATLGGPAGAQLGTDEDSIPAQLGPVDFEVGVIAGIATFNMFASAMLPEQDDGKVTVEATKVDGMQDFLIVDHSHRFMLKMDVVLRNTSAFLRTGSFIDADRIDAAGQPL